MSIRYKIDVMSALKDAGYSTTRIRNEKLIGQSYLQQIRHGEIVSNACLDKLCELLKCQPGDIIEYVEDENK
ncbi:MAG: helix-turn-helix domain-containing protein [Clostridia bacterium]|nr:helix-turn-helix domain-containing protein [Clostridia bacterium]MBR2389038.1 helix-turn-helix domain-containing protein [Clostridia bacterium]